MARPLTSDQRTLLRSDSVKARLLATFRMDDADYLYCDDVDDITDTASGRTWIGASALAECSDIKSGSNFSAEQVTITVDGARIHASGFTDPGVLFRSILELPLHNRRVDLEYGIGYEDETELGLIIPAYAGKINHVRVVASQAPFDSLPEGVDQAPQQKLEIVLDSIAIRYSWITGRTRSNADQQEIYPGDTFFRFVGDAVLNETKLYWGKKNPTIASSGYG